MKLNIISGWCGRNLPRRSNTSPEIRVRNRRVLAADQPAVRAAIFELEGVVSDDTAWRLWLFKVVTRAGLRTHYRAFFRMWDREFKGRCVSLGYWTTLRDFLHASGLTQAQIDEVEAAARPKLRSLRENVRALPQVVPTLQELARCGVRLVAVAPDLPTRLQQMLQQLHLEPVFELLHASSSDEADLAQLSRDLAVPPEQVVYVGRDVQALVTSRRLGLLTVACNADDDALADLYVEQLDQLLLVLPLNRPLLAAG